MTSASAAQIASTDSRSPTPEEVLGQLKRLLASRQLRESAQLQAFLEFIVAQTLAGQQDTLKEYLLGCQVFGRRADYDPRHDGIVRVQATTIRKRLEKYYSEDGVDDTVVIDLPRGGYVPAFRYAATAVTAIEAPISLPVAVPAVIEIVSKPKWMALGMAFCLGLMVAGIAAWALRPALVQPPYQVTTARQSDFPQLWTPFFAPGSRTLVAFGVPLFYSTNGIMIRDVRVNIPGQEADGRIAEFARKFNILPTPTNDIYTGVGEVVGTHLMANFLSTSGVPVRVASARSIGASDLNEQNLLVVSSLRFQTLLGKMKLPADFEFIGNSPEIIRNNKPMAGELPEYIFDSGAGISTSYALVSLWPGPTPGRRILCISGVHTWATQAATEFLIEPDQLRKVSDMFNKDQQTGAHGTPTPYFQILLRVEGRGNQSQKVEYLTHHYLPASK